MTSARQAIRESRAAGQLKVLAKVPAPALRVLAGVRSAGLWLLEPFDYVGRLINGKTYLPPLAIRREAGPLAGLEQSGGEFAAYLKLLCGLSSQSRVLDIGCGFGLIGLQLKQYLQAPGSYTGLDVSRQAIRWAARHISSTTTHFEFVHLDIQSSAYNPGGAVPADKVEFELPSSSFDVIVLKSVFTHLRPEAASNYLRQVQRLLSPNGSCLATFFMFEPHHNRESKARPPTVDFRFGDDTWRYAVREMPELAIAYARPNLVEMIATAGLSVKSMYCGTWTGGPGCLSYQDVVVLARSEGDGPAQSRATVELAKQR